MHVEDDLDSTYLELGDALAEDAENRLRNEKESHEDSDEFGDLPSEAATYPTFKPSITCSYYMLKFIRCIFIKLIIFVFNA